MSFGGFHVPELLLLELLPVLTFACAAVALPDTTPVGRAVLKNDWALDRCGSPCSLFLSADAGFAFWANLLRELKASTLLASLLMIESPKSCMVSGVYRSYLCFTIFSHLCKCWIEVLFISWFVYHLCLCLDTSFMNLLLLSGWVILSSVHTYVIPFLECNISCTTVPLEC